MSPMRSTLACSPTAAWAMSSRATTTTCGPRPHAHRPGDADDALQAALLRVVGEVKAGRTYPIPIRAVLHQVLTWTMREMWSSGRRRTAHLPEGWDAPDPEAADAFAEIEGTSGSRTSWECCPRESER